MAIHQREQRKAKGKEATTERTMTEVEAALPPFLGDPKRYIALMGILPLGVYILVRCAC